MPDSRQNSSDTCTIAAKLFTCRKIRWTHFCSQRNECQLYDSNYLSCTRFCPSFSSRQILNKSKYRHLRLGGLFLRLVLVAISETRGHEVLLIAERVVHLAGSAQARRQRRRGQLHEDLGDLYAESGQTLQGSLTAVSKLNFATKYALKSSRRDLHNAVLCSVL